MQTRVAPSATCLLEEPLERPSRCRAPAGRAHWPRRHHETYPGRRDAAAGHRHWRLRDRAALRRQRHPGRRDRREPRRRPGRESRPRRCSVENAQQRVPGGVLEVVGFALYVIRRALAPTLNQLLAIAALELAAGPPPELADMDHLVGQGDRQVQAIALEAWIEQNLSSSRHHTIGVQRAPTDVDALELGGPEQAGLLKEGHRILDEVHIVRAPLPVGAVSCRAVHECLIGRQKRRVAYQPARIGNVLRPGWQHDIRNGCANRACGLLSGFALQMAGRLYDAGAEDALAAAPMAILIACNGPCRAEGKPKIPSQDDASHPPVMLPHSRPPVSKQFTPHLAASVARWIGTSTGFAGPEAPVLVGRQGATDEAIAWR